jgi:hypothetical protein
VTACTVSGAVRAEGGEELVHRLLAAFSPDPDHPAGVVVGDHGQVLVTALVGDLVHTDPVEAVQPGPVDRFEVFGHQAFHRGVDRFPGAPQQVGDRGLVHALREPADHLLEIAGMPGRRPRPRHLLRSDPPAPSADDPNNVGFQP